MSIRHEREKVIILRFCLDLQREIAKELGFREAMSHGLKSRH
jgi:hypothetical protein